MPSNMSAKAPLRVVWSPAVRLLHWTLAISMITSFVTHENVIHAE